MTRMFLSMRLFCLATAVCLITAATLRGEGIEKPLRLWADGASYIYFQDSSKSYVEFYCALQREDIQFEEKEGRFLGTVYLDVEIMDRSNVVVDSLGWLLQLEVAALEEAYRKDFRIFEIFPSLLSPGAYKVKITAVDGTSRREGIATFEMIARDYSSGNLILSDLELAYKIERVDSTAALSSLIKGDRRVIPNPNHYYSNEDSLLYFYAELYNLAVRAGESDEFEIKISVSDSYGFELRDYPAIRHRKPGKTAVISEAIPISALPGGAYQLSVKIEDLATGRTTSSSRKFKLVYAFDQLTPTMTDSSDFTESDAELMEQVIRYITTSEEKATYKKLSLHGKREFLAKFWERKNPAPGSKINTFKDERFRRFNYANYYLSTSLVTRNDGWSTDRGRIYITYGNPNNIERVPSSMGQKPHERWTYDRLEGQSGGNYCLFVDENGYGNYRLVHSTIRGEISNPEAERKLEQGGTQ